MIKQIIRIKQKQRINKDNNHKKIKINNNQILKINNKIKEFFYRML